MMDIKKVLSLWFINFLIKNTQLVVFLRLQINLLLMVELTKMNNYLENFINQFLENFKREKYILHLKTIFGALI